MTVPGLVFCFFPDMGDTKPLLPPPFPLNSRSFPVSDRVPVLVPVPVPVSVSATALVSVPVPVLPSFSRLLPRPVPILVPIAVPVPVPFTPQPPFPSPSPSLFALLSVSRIWLSPRCNARAQTSSLANGFIRQKHWLTSCKSAELASR